MLFLSTIQAKLRSNCQADAGEYKPESKSNQDKRTCAEDNAMYSFFQHSPDRWGEISHDKPGSAAAIPHAIGISTASQSKDPTIVGILGNCSLRCFFTRQISGKAEHL